MCHDPIDSPETTHPPPPPALFRVEHATGLIEWSPELKAILGVPADIEPAWDVFWKVLHPDDRVSVFREIMRSLDPHGPRCFSLRHRVLREDGTIRELLVAAFTSFVESGPVARPVRTMGKVVDLTEMQEASHLPAGLPRIQAGRGPVPTLSGIRRIETARNWPEQPAGVNSHIAL